MILDKVYHASPKSGLKQIKPQKGEEIYDWFVTIQDQFNIVIADNGTEEETLNIVLSFI